MEDESERKWRTQSYLQEDKILRNKLSTTGVLDVYPMHPFADLTPKPYEPDLAAADELIARRPAWLDEQLELARLFKRVDETVSWLSYSSSSTSHFGAKYGYDRNQALGLARLGYALEGEPRLEAWLHARRISFAEACWMGRIYEVPLAIEPDDQWLEWAGSMRFNDFRRKVSERLEGHRNQLPDSETDTYTAAVTRQTKEDLERCRAVASQKADKLLSKGQALTVLSLRFLLDEDPTYTPSRPRRMPPTSEDLDSRGIPADVVKAIFERSGGQ